METSDNGRCNMRTILRPPRSGSLGRVRVVRNNPPDGARVANGCAACATAMRTTRGSRLHLIKRTFVNVTSRTLVNKPEGPPYQRVRPAAIAANTAMRHAAQPVARRCVTDSDPFWIGLRACTMEAIQPASVGSVPCDTV